MESIGTGIAPLEGRRIGMRNKFGFSLMELTVVIAVGAIISAIAVPSVINWRGKAKMREAISTLRNDLELAKVRAIQENDFVVIKFSENSYLIFVDSGDAGGAGKHNWSHNSGEKRLRRRQLPSGVRIDLAQTSFNGGNITRFTGRGRIDTEKMGKVVLVSSNGIQREIIMNNRFGRIDIN
jgi:prepilin-type N-terminal cleavage/methylation domain-containing protein